VTFFVGYVLVLVFFKFVCFMTLMTLSGSVDRKRVMSLMSLTLVI